MTGEPTGSLEPVVRIRIALTLALMALLVGCRAERTIDPLSRRVEISGSDTLMVGQLIRLSAALSAAAGAPPEYGLVWTSSDGQRAALNTWGVPFQQIEVLGRAAGTVTISATLGSTTGTHTISVLDARPVVPVAIGKTIMGRISNGVGAERVALTLAPGDTVDLAVRSDSAGSNLHLESIGGGLELVRPAQTSGLAIYGALVAPAAGTYHLDAFADRMCISRGCSGGLGSYTLTVRRSAPILNVVVIPTFQSVLLTATLDVPQGGVAKDTTWVQNLGLGTLHVDVSTPPSLWLQPDATRLSATGPVRIPAAVTAPATDVTPQGTMLTSTVRPGGLAQGIYSDSLVLVAQTPVWSTYTPSARLRRRVEMRVYDSTVRVISRTTAISWLAVRPNGEVIGSRADSVFSIDPVSGRTTLLVHLAGFPLRIVMRIIVGGDGALYLGEFASSGGTIHRVVGGTTQAITGWPSAYAGGFAVLADGTIYAFFGTRLHRRTPNGAIEALTDPGISATPSGLQFSPSDSSLYFLAGGALRRYDLGRNVFETLGAVTSLPSLLAIDSRGRLYGPMTDGPGFIVLDETGGVVERIITPGWVESIAVGAGMIYGTNRYTTVWRMPVR